MKKCKIVNCEKKVKSGGYCSGHAERYRKGLRGKELEAPLAQKSKPGESTGFIGTNGYVYVSKKGKKYLLHRVLMEKYLGRKLLTEEHVHHLDGNPLNNNIENLVLSSQSEHIMLYHKKNSFFCCIIGCENKTSQCGMCAAHEKRTRRHGDPLPEIPIGLHTSVLKKMKAKIELERTLGEYAQFIKEKNF